MLERFAVTLPDGLHNTNIGNIAADSLPLTSMLCCLPTLSLFWRHRRLVDLVVLLIGFLLACIYHVCHMAPEGLVASQLMGISGPVWRSLDVLYAQWLLGRTFGHAVGASHKFSKGVTNAAFPALLLHRALAGGQLSVGVCGQALLCTLAAGLAAKLVLEGFSALPQYPKARGSCTAALFVAGFVAFPLPELFPRHYWLFHSLWHAFLGAGYYELYAMLEDKNCKTTQPSVDVKEATRVHMTASSAAVRDQTAADLVEERCKEQSQGTAGAARMVAYCGDWEDGSGARRRLQRREVEQPREAAEVERVATGIERVVSGQLPQLHAARVRLWSISLQRLARVVCLHS